MYLCKLLSPHEFVNCGKMYVIKHQPISLIPKYYINLCHRNED